MSAERRSTGKLVPTFSESDDAAFRQRLRELVDKLGSAKVAADAAEVSQTTIDRWRSGPHMPPFDRITILCRAAQIYVEWLATGEGPRDIQPEVDLSNVKANEAGGRHSMASVGNTLVSAPDVRLLPMLSVEPSAGHGLIPPSEEVSGYVAISEEYLRRIGVSPRYAHVLRVSGRSMVPTINDDDIVVVDTSVRSAANDGIYTLVYGEAVLIKRIRLLRDGGVILVSDNKTEGYLDETIPRSELATLSIVGRVKGHIRAL